MSVLDVLDRRQAANFVGNEWAVSAGPPVAAVNPADPADALPPAPDSTPGDVDAAVAAALQAAPGWAAVPGPQRGDVLRRWNELIGEHTEELAALMTREMGKPLAESRAELGRARLELDYAAGEGTRLHGQTIPSRAPGQLVYTEREPLGVVAAITPWNFPAVAPIRKLGPALVAGNAVVLKPAPQTPLTALVLADLLRQAGLPAGVLGVVCGGAVAGAHLAAHRDVAGVSFTGSTGVGHRIAEVVAARLGVVQLELGGKNAAYVHSATDLGKVVEQITSAAAQTSGQRCTSIANVIVQEDLADELVGLLTAKYDALRVGPGTDPDSQVGPLVDQTQFERVDGYVRGGLEAGATRVTADRRVPEGPYYPPTVLDHVTPDMVIAREEIFGPVLSVLRVSNVEQAVEVVNASGYGLAGVVFTEDLDVAMRFSRAARTGMVHVNHGTISQPHVPFGGFGESGVGAFSIGYTATDFFTRLKTVYLSPEVP